MPREPELTEEEHDALVEHWDKRLAADGLHAEPRRKLRRGPDDGTGRRPWLGSWEYSSPLGAGHSPTMVDVATYATIYNTSSRRPRNEYEALLVKPDSPIDVSADQLLELRDLLYDVAEVVLTSQEQIVMRAHVISGLTLVETGEVLGQAKSTIHQAKERALDKLRDALADHPTIIEYLNRHDVPDE
jgi:predicted DNA-binding protein (UPF0251 family)